MYTNLYNLKHKCLHTVPLNYNFIFPRGVHVWCHAVFLVENSTITCGNKILHVTRHGILHGIYMQVYTTCVIYTGQLLAMEVSYTIHEKDN